MDESKLRAFALAAIASMSLRNVQTLGEDELDSSDIYRRSGLQAQMTSSIAS
jgi:hypothetical protein